MYHTIDFFIYITKKIVQYMFWVNSNYTKTCTIHLIDRAVILKTMKNFYLLVNSSMNFDDDTNEVDQRKRINGVLDISEVTFILILMDSECIWREEFVLGCLEHRVFKAPNESDPFNEFLFRVLSLTRRVHILLVSWS